MLNSALNEFPRQVLALLNTDCSHQDGLPERITSSNIFYDSAELGVFRLIDEICCIIANNIAVSRNWHYLEAVCVHQFGSFSLRGSGHARQFVVHTEIVLQCDSCQRLVFFVNTKTFFCFYSLVNTLTPTATFQNASSEFIDDLHFATINDVVLVAAIQLFCLESNSELVHQVLLNCVVQVVDTEALFNFFDAGFSWNDDLLVFFDFVVCFADKRAHDRCKLVIHSCSIGNTAGNNERRPGFVNENAVHFVDNRKVMTTLHFVV